MFEGLTQKRKRIACLMMAVVMIFLLVACAPQASDSPPAATASTQTTSPASATAPAQGASNETIQPPEADAYTYPIEGNKKLTINMNAPDTSGVPSWAIDHYIWDEVQRHTGVTLE